MASKEKAKKRTFADQAPLLPCVLATLLLLGASGIAHAATAQEYYAAGEKLFKAGDYAKAVQYLNAAVKLDPKHKNAYYLLGNAYHRQGSSAAAITAIKASLRLDQGNTQVQAFLSRLQGAAPGGKAKPAAKHPPGSVVIFDDRYPLGVTETLNEVATKVELWQKDAAFGRACLRYRGDVEYKVEARGELQAKGIGSTINWFRAWGASGAKPGDLAPFREKGALVFWIRGKNGGEYFTLALASTPEKDIVDKKYGGDSRFRTYRSINSYVHVSTRWQKVIIPLADFSEKGRLWGSRGRGRGRTHIEDMDWTRIEQLAWGIDAVYADEYEIYLDEIAIVPEYDTAEYERLKRTAKISREETALDGEGNLVIFDEYPRGAYRGADHVRFMLDETTAKVGKMSFQYVMTPKGGWTWIGIDHLDFTPYYERGHLEFWVKGKNGDEKFAVRFVGVSNEGWPVYTTLNVASYVTVSGKWRKVRIPLADFPNGSWGSVAQFAVVAGPCKEQELTFWLDDIKVTTK